jgi:hypothetical protein
LNLQAGLKERNSKHTYSRLVDAFSLHAKPAPIPRIGNRDLQLCDQPKVTEKTAGERSKVAQPTAAHLMVHTLSRRCTANDLPPSPDANAAKLLLLPFPASPAAAAATLLLLLPVLGGMPALPAAAPTATTCEY